MTSYALALESVFGLICLWIFCMYFWRDYRLDAFREHLFSIRNRLLIYAVKNGGGGVDEPAYRLLEHRINIILRYAHEFTMTRLIFFALFGPKGKPEAARVWQEALVSVPNSERRAKFEEFSYIVAFAVLQYIVYRPFLLYLLVRPIVGAIQSLSPIDIRQQLTTVPQVTRNVERLEAEAVEEFKRDELELVGAAS